LLKSMTSVENGSALYSLTKTVELLAIEKSSTLKTIGTGFAFSTTSVLLSDFTTGSLQLKTAT